MKTNLPMQTLCAAALLALVAFMINAFIPHAHAQTVTDQYKRELKPRDWVADQVMEQRLRLFGSLTVDGGCIGCTTAIGSFTYDFPTLTTVSGGVVAAETPAQTVPGAAFGDGCDPSSNLGVDGGARLLPEAWLTCTCATNSGYLQLRANFSDAGTYNLHDAGFTIRCNR